jgi:signal transduction histidine kinase
VTRCRLIRLGKTDFRKLLEESRELERNLLAILGSRLRQSNLTYVHREEDNILTARNQINRLQTLIDAARIVNSSLSVKTLLKIILGTATTMVNAARGTLYLIDEESGELWSHVISGAETVEIRLAIGQGIAGHVARTGKVVNLENVYEDPHFNPEFDRISGYVSRSMLCMPLRNKNGKSIGVFQLLNKAGGPFDGDDENFIEALSIHASNAIENARLAERMVEEERLSAVGRMAGTIVHDIKNPLNVLRLSAEVISSKTKSREVIQVTGMMIKQIDRFVSMAQEIIEFSRGTSSLKIGTINTGELVKTVAEIYTDEIKRKGIGLNQQMGYRGPIEGDPDKIIRALQNIVGNSVDAMGKGGTLSITTGKSGSSFWIEVGDTGPGIPDDMKSDIFKPFVTRGKKHGAGLGLSIVKKIVEDHHGTIGLESGEGKGTCIRVTLPLRMKTPKKSR